MYLDGLPPGVMRQLDEQQAELINTVFIAREFGWTIEYVEGLAPEKRDMVEAVLAGENEARARALKRK